MKLLRLQIKVPSRARFHLLLEAERTLSSSDTVNIELLSLFSTTVSNETDGRRKSTCLLGESLLDFKLHCESERVGDVDPAQPHVRPVTVRPQQPLSHPPVSNAPVSNEVAQPVSEPSHSHSQSPPPIDQNDQSPPENMPTSNSDVGTHDQNAADVDDDPDSMMEDNINSGWVVAPDEISAKMDLPSWFPPPPPQMSATFRSRCISVDIDRFHHLTYDQSIFVYRGLIRTAHRRSLHDYFRTMHGDNVNFRTSFSFKSFTPPLGSAANLIVA